MVQDKTLTLRQGTHFYPLPDTLQELPQQRNEAAPTESYVVDVWEGFLSIIAEQGGRLVAVVEQTVQSPLSPDFFSPSGTSERTAKFAIIEKLE